jgi:hypothetical protein
LTVSFNLAKSHDTNVDLFTFVLLATTSILSSTETAGLDGFCPNTKSVANNMKAVTVRIKFRFIVFLV